MKQIWEGTNGFVLNKQDCYAVFNHCELTQTTCNIPSEIKYKGKKYPVTQIDSHAFRYNARIQQITIPNSIVEIEPDSFIGCIKLKEITLPNTINTIGSCAFADCVNLEQITLPEKLVTVHWHSFENCDKLKQIICGKELMKDIAEDCEFFGLDEKCEIKLTPTKKKKTR